MSSEITRSEYWAEVKSLAEEGAREAVSGSFGAGDDAREGLEQWIWETCDGHQWVIYTWASHFVLAHSENDAYSIENFGAESVIQDGAINWAALAFGALYADVMDALSRLDEIDGHDFEVNDPNPEPDEDSDDA